MYRVPSINNYTETRGKLRKSKLDLDEIRQAGELNQLLYWKYYLEVYSPKEFDIGDNLKSIRERLFYKHNWTEENWEHSIPGILYLLISIPATVYKKDLSQICERLIDESSYGDRFEDDLGSAILEYYFYPIGDDLISESTLNQAKVELYKRYGFSEEEAKWIDLNWNTIRKNQDRWLKFKSRILDNIEVFDLWMVLNLTNYDPINMDSKGELDDFLDDLIKRLSPDIHYCDELIEQSKNESDHSNNILKWDSDWNGFIYENQHYSTTAEDKDFKLNERQWAVIKILDDEPSHQMHSKKILKLIFEFLNQPKPKISIRDIFNTNRKVGDLFNTLVISEGRSGWFRLDSGT